MLYQTSRPGKGRQGSERGSFAATERVEPYRLVSHLQGRGRDILKCKNGKRNKILYLWQVVLGSMGFHISAPTHAEPDLN